MTQAGSARTPGRLTGSCRAALASGRAALAPGRTALSLFTVIPVAASRRLDAGEAARAVRWLPAVGILLALPAGGVLLATGAGGHSAPRSLLAAALAVVAMGLLTGGLHLDGLADTADGLGSRRPRDEALAIMRRPDVGPLGVAALLGVGLVQILALATLGGGWLAAAALGLAVTTGRVAVVLATGPGTPAARADGLGVLVAATTPPATRFAMAGTLFAVAGAGGYLLGGLALTARGLAAVLAALAAAGLLRRTAVRRLGGVTGDVFGALVEVATATALLVLAVTG